MAEAEQKINGATSTEAMQVIERRHWLDYSPEQIQLIKDVYAKGASDLEFEFFLNVSRHRALDIIAGQLWLVERYDTSLGRNVKTPQTSIDGYRVLAERSASYAGQVGPWWCGPDGEWKDVWLSDKPPVAARVGVVRKDWAEPVYAVARYSAYVQLKKDGTPNKIWQKMSDLMLAKCAEALALRKAFPQQTSGIYTHEEMGQAQMLGDAAPAVIEASVVNALPAAGMITTDQKKRLKKLTDSLLEFEIPAVNLQKKMAADHNVERSADLTEKQADMFIADLYDWLNSLEESRAANMPKGELEEVAPVTGGKKVEVPF
jgi:phage recombination protein Bet